MRARDVGLVVLCGGLTYLSALGNPFAFDDEYAVQNNGLLEDGAGLWHLLTRPGLTGGAVLSDHYRPLAMATLWLDRQLFGLDPLGYRVVNLVLHLVCALLAGVFVERLWRRSAVLQDPASVSDSAPRIAQLTALLFCVTPLCSEAVEQIFKRTSSLTTACMLGALIAFDRAFAPNGPGGSSAPPQAQPLPPPASPQKALIALSLGLSALGLLAKESAAVMPGLIGLYGLWCGLFRARPRLGWVLVLAFCAAPLALIAWVKPWGAAAAGEHAGLRHLLAQPSAFAEYAAMLVLPSRVPIVMGIEPTPWPPGAWPVLGLAALCGALVWATWARFRSRAPLASFAVWFGAICVAPTSSVVPMKLVADPIHVYLAIIPVLALVAWALSALHHAIASRLPASLSRVRPLLGALPAVLVLLASALGTMQVSERYQDPASAWLHAAQLYPQGRLPNVNACITDRDPVRAFATCRRAQALEPGNPFVVVRVVMLLAAQRRFTEAEAELERMRAGPITGSSWPLELAEARLALLQGDLPRAHDAFREVLVHNPGQVEARVFLADIRLRLGIAGAAELVAGLTTAPDAATYALLGSVRARLHAGPPR